jgi:hypothetical protein
MTARPTAALRFGLHLLLAACLLLQATVALALGTAMSMTTATAADAVEAVETVSNDLPPCHAAAAAVPQPADTAAAHGCCNDDGGLCEWVCATAPPLVITRLAFVIAGPPGIRPMARVATSPSWPVTAPLRPPIA